MTLSILLLTHAAVTLAMTGVIWFVQLVHYPLFLRVGESGWVEYERHHVRRTTWIVAPLMLGEVITGSALMLHSGVDRRLAAAGLVLIAVAWLSTALIQVPLHRRLEARFDADDVRRLVSTNWIRTMAWSLRAALALWMAFQAASAATGGG